MLQTAKDEGHAQGVTRLHAYLQEEHGDGAPARDVVADFLRGDEDHQKRREPRRPDGKDRSVKALLPRVVPNQGPGHYVAIDAAPDCCILMFSETHCF